MSKSQLHTDKVPVLVHALQNAEVYGLAQKVWEVNARSLLSDPANGKEYIHLTYANPTCLVWLQRDQGRTDTFELILRWDPVTTDLTEAYTITTTAGPAVGNDQRAKQLLQTMLAAPAIVPATGRPT